MDDALGMDGRCPGYGWTIPGYGWTMLGVWMEDAPKFCKREAQTWLTGPWMLLGESKRKQWPNSSSPHRPSLSCGPNNNAVMSLLYFFINLRKFHMTYFNHIPTPSFSQITSSSLTTYNSCFPYYILSHVWSSTGVWLTYQALYP